MTQDVVPFREERLNALVLGGGIGLAAYHAGVYEALQTRDQQVDILAGSSAGAVIAALIAGNAPDRRIDAMRKFWSQGFRSRLALPLPQSHVLSWMSALRYRLTGSAGHFTPRLPDPRPFTFRSFYDLAPMRRQIGVLIDFDRLNGGDLPLLVATVDIVTGEPVIFDSRKHVITPDVLLASCGFLPEFEPLEIDGRFLGDGGLALNVPFDPLLACDRSLRLIVSDLFPAKAPRPQTLEAAAERKNDVMFANQTLQRLAYFRELRRVRGFSDDVTVLAYQSGPEEPGPEKPYDLSGRAIDRRWRAGFVDMMATLDARESGPAETPAAITVPWLKELRPGVSSG